MKNKQEAKTRLEKEKELVKQIVKYCEEYDVRAHYNISFENKNVSFEVEENKQ